MQSSRDGEASQNLPRATHLTPCLCTPVAAHALQLGALRHQHQWPAVRVQGQGQAAIRAHHHHLGGLQGRKARHQVITMIFHCQFPRFNSRFKSFWSYGCRAVSIRAKMPKPATFNRTDRWWSLPIIVLATVDSLATSVEYLLY